MLQQDAPTTRAPAARHRRYALVSPCRNEAEFMRKTLDSVIAQSVPPALWVIVDDGSTDDTPAILAEYAERHPWIRVVTRSDRGTRSVGPGVIEAFYAGYETLRPVEYEYICKLDLDLILPERYFERLMEKMEAEPRIGTCSGKAYYVGPEGEMISEGIGDEVSVGASKFYRVACFKQIGGFVRQVMWDGIDTHRCRMHGWIPCSFDEPDLNFTHLRPMGSSQKGIWTGRKRHGFGQYFMGTGFVYITASAVYRLIKPPVLIGSLAIWWGYVESALKRVKRYDDPAFRKFMRRFQWQSLLKGKAAAARLTNERQASAWNGGRAP